MKKKTIKKFLSLILAVLMAFTTLVPAFALTAGTKANITKRWLSGLGSYSAYGKSGQMDRTSLSDGTPLYCIQYSASLSGSTATAKNIESTSAWKNLSATAKKGISLVSMYGGGKGCADSTYAATQILIWEFQLGKREQTGSKMSISCGSAFSSYVKGSVKTQYEKITTAISKHSLTPSFSSSTVALSGVGTSYAKTISDSNGVSQSYDYHKSNGDAAWDTTKISVSRTSSTMNTLKIYAKKAFTGTTTITGTRTFKITNALCLEGAGQTLWYGYLDDPVTFTLNVKADLGTCKIVKTNSSKADAVSGFEFKIYNSSNTLVSTLKTAADGTISTTLAAGTYTVKETQANGYKAQSAQTVTIKAGETSTVKFDNSYLLGSVKIKKISSDNVIEGMKFRLTGTSATGESVKIEVATDAQGLATFNNVPISNASGYTIEEYDVPDRYQVPSAKPNIMVTANEPNIDLTQDEDDWFKNRILTGQANIVKIDADTEETIQLEGFGFKLQNVDTGEYLSLDTDANGEEETIFYTDNTGYTTGLNKFNIPFEKFGTYIAYEVVCPKGYTINSEPSDSFIIDENPAQAMRFRDKQQKGDIILSKKGEMFVSVKEDNGVFTPVFEERYLADAVYGVYALENVYTPTGSLMYNKDELVTKITTNDTGTAESGGLTLGKYYVKEISAPTGFVLSDEKQIVDLTSTDNTTEIFIKNVSFTDQHQKVNINFIKNAESDDTFGIDGTAEFKDIKFGLYADETITALDGTTIPKGSLISISGIDTDGTGIFDVELPQNDYYVKEIATSDKYIIDNEEYPVEYRYNNNNTTLNIIELNDGEPIENYLIRGTINGSKIDEIGNAVQGALIGLFPIGTEQFTSENAILTITSDEQGEFVFENVPYGEWMIAEISAPIGFVLNTASQVVNISENNQNKNVTIVDEHIMGDLIINKVDSETHKFINNVEFTIYKDVNGNGKIDEDDYEYDKAVTAEDILLQKQLMTGMYEFYLKDNDGATYNDFLQDFIFKLKDTSDEDGTVKIDDSVTFTVDLKLLDRFYNYASWLYNISDEAIKSNYTDTYVAAALTAGDYIAVETKAAEGYVQDKGAYPFSVTADEQVITVSNGKNDEFTNKQIKGSLEITKIDSTTKKPLKGAQFVLADAKGNKLETKTTDANGKIIFNDLPYGKYTVSEIIAPKGYRLAKQSVSFTIKTDGQIIKQTFTNEKVPATKNPTTGDNTLALWLVSMLGMVGVAGATYAITKKTSGKKKKLQGK